MEQRTYDPRREERRKATRLAVPDDVDARLLDPEVRQELRSLTRETADLVARHLVMTARLLDDDPQGALAHARAARAMAGRIGVVREAAGLAAYAAGEWAEALSELRAARRITGRPVHLAVLADCERALDRPDRALAYADDPDVPSLPQEDRVELVIVIAGARRDLGQADAAVLVLQDPARRTTPSRSWAARLWYAYADALLAAGREGEARTWFEKAAAGDPSGDTDAGDRLLELDGVVLEDLDEDETDSAGMPDDELAAYVAEVFPRPAPEPWGVGAPPAGTAGGAAGGGDDPAPPRDVDGGSGGEPPTAPARPAPASLLPQFASAADSDDDADDDADDSRSDPRS